MIGVGVAVGMFQLMIQRPAAEILELNKELQNLKTAHAQIKQEQIHLNEAVTKTLPARQNAVFERLNQVTGRLDQLGETITRVASRDTRPDKFTGADGNRMESRLTAQHDADIVRIEQADHDMQGKLAKLERVCVPPTKIQFNGPGR
jgi:type II secretory pathway component PulM